MLNTSDPKVLEILQTFQNLKERVEKEEKKQHKKTSIPCEIPVESKFQGIQGSKNINFFWYSDQLKTDGYRLASTFDTEDIETIFNILNNRLTFIPNYKNCEYSIVEPLFHEKRAASTYVWLAKLGTSKYLDVIEEVNINVKRIAQLVEGFLPLTVDLQENMHLLKIVETERQEKSCPLLMFRDLGNGYYVLLNVNDMVRYSLDHVPLAI